MKIYINRVDPALHWIKAAEIRFFGLRNGVRMQRGTSASHLRWNEHYKHIAAKALYWWTGRKLHIPAWVLRKILSPNWRKAMKNEEPMNVKNPAVAPSLLNDGLTDFEPSLNGKGSAEGVLYSERYDAFYNAETGAWLEKKCENGDCDYCGDRPENALMSANVKLTSPPISTL